MDCHPVGIFQVVGEMWELDIRYWILDGRFWMRDTRCWILDVSYGICMHNPKHKISEANEVAVVGAWRAMPISEKEIDILFWLGRYVKLPHNRCQKSI